MNFVYLKPGIFFHPGGQRLQVSQLLDAHQNTPRAAKLGWAYWRAVHIWEPHREALPGTGTGHSQWDPALRGTPDGTLGSEQLAEGGGPFCWV